MIIAVTTALLWWKVDWILAVGVGLVEVCAAIGWESDKKGRVAVNQWINDLFE